MTVFDRSELIEVLANDVVEITFTKKNGEERIMKCTLRDDIIENMSNTSPVSSGRKVNPDVIPVFDLDKNDWRSFRVDSVKAIAYSINSLSKFNSYTWSNDD